MGSQTSDGKHYSEVSVLRAIQKPLRQNTRNFALDQIQEMSNLIRSVALTRRKC